VQELAVLAQIPLVGLQGVLGGALLDADVVEPASDLAVELRDPRARLCDRVDQESASSSEIDDMP
jgi:hypothetical protein